MTILLIFSILVLVRLRWSCVGQNVIQLAVSIMNDEMCLIPDSKEFSHLNKLPPPNLEATSSLRLYSKHERGPHGCEHAAPISDEIRLPDSLHSGIVPNRCPRGEKGPSRDWRKWAIWSQESALLLKKIKSRICGRDLPSGLWLRI